MNNDMETVIWELCLPNLCVAGGMMGSNKVRMMVGKNEEEKKDKEDEEEESTVKTLQIKSGNILALLCCFRNLGQVGGILLSQTLQQAFRTRNIKQICL